VTPQALPPLQPSPRLLLGPGPSNVPGRVLAALGCAPVGHLDPEFIALMDETQDLLRHVFRSSNPMTLAVSGTGSAGMEAVILNLVEPGDRVLIGVNGVFGGRMAEIARRAGAEVQTIERPWGEVFDPDEVRGALAQHRPKLVGLVHAETSTGALQPISEIARIIREHDALLALDTVTSLAGSPLFVDSWEIDAVYSGTQKCLSCPPGLAPVTFGPRAVKVIQDRSTPVRSWYLDMTLIGKYWGSDRAYHHTAPINMNYALREALAIVAEEGLDTRIARHTRHGAALRAGLKALGFSYAPQEAHALPQLHCVQLPPGLEDAATRKRLLQEWHIEIGAGLGPFQGKAWRIGLMGHNSRRENVTLLLSALETCLREAGVKIDPGAALAAASEVYQSLDE